MCSKRSYLQITMGGGRFVYSRRDGVIALIHSQFSQLSTREVELLTKEHFIYLEVEYRRIDTKDE